MMRRVPPEQIVAAAALVLLACAWLPSSEAGCPSNYHCYCDSNTNQCDQTYGCQEGYWKTPNCTEPCDPNMHCTMSCDSDDGTCRQCVPGYWNSSYCNRACNASYHCHDVCDPDTGGCLGRCAQNYYGDNCDKACPAQCYDGRCNGTGICDSCVNGWWGPKCDQSCRPSGSHCAGLDVTCDQDEGGCVECRSNYWGHWCNLTCSSPHCGGNQCDQDTGICVSAGYEGYCQDGWYGDNCDKACPSKCESGCDRNNGTCSRCVDGFWGELCDQSCKAGGRHCNATVCGFEDGSCDRFGGQQCDFGWYGPLCSIPCINKHCYQNECDPESGLCPDDGYDCTPGWWGVQCNSPCKTAHCPDNNSCDRSTGNCTGQCDHNWWGPNCDKKCSDTIHHCYNGECDRRTSVCYTGNGDCAVNYRPYPQCTDIDCEGGYYTKSNGDCGVCPPGTYSRMGDSCTNCEKGKYQPNNASTDCMTCPPGTITPHAGATSCLSCNDQGSFRDGDSCVVCEAGKIVNDKKDACVGCPTGRYAEKPGSPNCTQCPENTYADDPGTVKCKKCPGIGFSSKGASKCQSCGFGHEKHDLGNGSYNCALCPDHWYTSGKTTTCDLKCEVCMKGTQCVSGYAGPGCPLCAVGYYRANNGVTCNKCDSFPWILLIGLAVIIIVGLFLYYKGVSLQTIVFLKILANFIQLIILVSSITVFWPGSVKWTRDFLNITTGAFQNVRAECYSSWSWADKVYASIWLPIIFVSLGVIADRFVVYKRKQLSEAHGGLAIDSNQDRKLHQLSNSIRRVLLLFVTLTYTPIVQMMLSVHQCHGHPARLRADERQLCSGSEYDSMKRFAAAWGVIVGLGMPLVMGITVFFIQRSERGLHHGDMLDTFGPLYEPYREGAAWFETVMLSRKAVMLIFLSFIESGIGQSVINVFFSAGYTALIFKLQPFASEFMTIFTRRVDVPNALELASGGMTAFNCVLAFFVGVIDKKGGSYFFGALFLIANLLAVIAFCFKFYFETRAGVDALEDESVYKQMLETEESKAVSSLLGEHVAELLVELSQKRLRVQDALRRKQLREAESLVNQAANIDGRLLSEMERQMKVGETSLNVDQAKEARKWLDEREARLNEDRQVIGSVEELSAQFAERFDSMAQPNAELLALRQFYPQVKQLHEHLEQFLVHLCGSLDPLITRGTDNFLFGSAAAGLRLRETMDQALLRVSYHKMGSPDEKQLKTAIQLEAKWLDTSAKFHNKLSKDFAALEALRQTQPAEEKAWQSHNERITSLYTKMGDNVANVWEFFDNRLVPACLAARRYRELQQLSDEFTASIRERAGVRSVDAATAAAGDRSAMAWSRQDLDRMVAERQQVGRTLLAQGLFEQGQTEIRHMREWLVYLSGQYRAEEELHMHGLRFREASNAAQLGMHCAFLVRQLDQKGGSNSARP